MENSLEVIKLSTTADSLLSALENKEPENHEPKISVNRFVSEVASWYEKLRNAMDYRDEEAILRASIERILKRRIKMGQDGNRISATLLRELIWARYFPNNSIPVSYIEKVADEIDNYLLLKSEILRQKILPEKTVNEWIYHLLSASIARFLDPKKDKSTVGNFMYHVMKSSVVIEDDEESTKNVQVYLAVKRAFARDDIAYLRYYLFLQIFGELEKNNIHEIAANFKKGYKEIDKQLNYPLKEKIFLYVKGQTPEFFILEDILTSHKNDVRELLVKPEAFAEEVLKACEVRYKGIGAKVRTAIIRSVVFILVTKALFAWVIEGTYDRLVYGHVILSSLFFNIGIPPLLMVIVSLFIRTPNKENSKKILAKINTLLFDNEPKLAHQLVLGVKAKDNSIFNTIFGILWLMAFLVSFGIIILILNKLHFNIVSQGVFVFFVAIVSFLAYRINLTAHMYTVEERQNLITPFIDLLILPIVRAGMWFTEGVSQINVIIFIFDFLIEIPFKAIFAFFDGLFIYLHTKREDLE